jgi:DNA-binding CsgD family transcriptional regulator
LATAIERYINREVASRRIGATWITFGEIAARLGISEALVQSYLGGFSGSSDNSIEIWR